MFVEIHGVELPGRTCGTYENVHVGLGLRAEPHDLVPADASDARWRVDVHTPTTNGDVDFRGKFVHGPRGDRFLYLNWGTLDAQGKFELFRRAKLILSEVPPKLVQEALSSGAGLACTVKLTDECGMPRCARVRPPFISWRLASTD
jgi:hypothetical protein